MTRRIRVFLSSPMDVADERQQCADVVEDLNVTFDALIPEQDVRLDLIRWETHTSPSLAGSPQGAVDKQIDPADCDIFVGIMWSRFGTPTKSGYGSGTEHELRAAERGWEKDRRPSHIQFYFCNAPVENARKAAKDLVAIDKLYDELRLKGLIGTYKDRTRFAVQFRRDLLVTLKGLLHPAGGTPQLRADTAVGVTAADLDTVWRTLDEESAEYDRIRRTMLGGDPRTRRMEVVASRLRGLADSIVPLLPALTEHDKPGHRLAAVCALQVRPSRDYLDWLGDRISLEKPFVGYHAAIALLAAARALQDEDLTEVERSIRNAEEGAADLRSDTDRMSTLALAERELARRRQPDAARPRD